MQNISAVSLCTEWDFNEHKNVYASLNILQMPVKGITFSYIIILYSSIYTNEVAHESFIIWIVHNYINPCYVLSRLQYCNNNESFSRVLSRSNDLYGIVKYWNQPVYIQQAEEVRKVLVNRCELLPRLQKSPFLIKTLMFH